MASLYKIFIIWVFMIKKLIIYNFKAFHNYEIDFSNINILVGPNNAGKTSIFHALQLFYTSLEKIYAEDHEKVILSKTQISEIDGVPYINIKDIFFNQRLREGRGPLRLKIVLEIDNLPPIEIQIYQAFSTNFMITGSNLELTKEQYKELLKYKPVFIPSTIGVTNKEDLFRTIAQDQFLSEGRHNEIIRNMIYRISKQTNWNSFKDVLIKLFKIKNFQIPFNEDADRWITALYSENEIEIDIISAGSGFLQVLNIVCFLYLFSKRNLALIDEPDAHMHEDLQRVLFKTLSDVSRDNNIQLLISTHSQILINEANINNILLIDKSKNSAEKVKKYEDLIPFFQENGLSLPTPKIIELIKHKKIVFIEGKEADYDNFIKIFGSIINVDFEILTKNIVPISTNGETNIWPFESIKLFESILGDDLNYIYIADRDLCTDEQIEKKKERASRENSKIFYLSYRNRECYLLNPNILEKLLKDKWESKNHNTDFPDNISENEIKNYFLNKSKEYRDETQASFIQYQQRYTRDGDASKEKENLTESNKYFNKEYHDVLSNNELPLRLLDGKKILKDFRKFISDNYLISFNDKDIISLFQIENIPNEINEIIKEIINLL